MALKDWMLVISEIKKCDAHDKCSNLRNGKKCKKCEDVKQGIEFCLNECENVVDKKLCESCRHMKTGIFNNKVEIKSHHEPKFKDLLNEITTEYGYEG